MLGRHLNHCEDSLTAAIFSHLLHLPAELAWPVLRNACYGPELPAHAGEPESISPFPKWNPAGTRNNTYVEPDLFLRFREFDLIVEAKRWDEGMQKRSQWQDELIAYANEFGEERRVVMLVALGGVHGTASEEVRHAWQPPLEAGGDARGHLFVCPVVMCRWRRLLGECQRMARELANAKYKSAQSRAHQRVLADLVHLFAAHGFQTGKWFSELASELPRLSARPETAHAIFQQMSAHFSRA